MLTSLQHRKLHPPETETDTPESILVPRNKKKRETVRSPGTPSLPRRRLRSQTSQEMLEASEDSDRPDQEVLGRRIQELLQLYERSRSKHGASLLPMRYIDLNAIVEGKIGEEDVNNGKLVTRMSHEGIFYCFRLNEGWTPMPFATQLFPVIPPRPLPSLDSLTGNKKRKSRAHVLPPGSLSLIPFGEDERLVWTKRIFRFIGKMRKVLGDRRIRLPWGGSIIDSVIGVYITQNVSDTFSSKAFMNIAAKFPSSKPRTENSDIVDWKRVLHSPVTELSDCIECRGMQNILAHRIMSGNIASLIMLINDDHRRFLKQVEDGTIWKWWHENQEAAKHLMTTVPVDEFYEVIVALTQLLQDLNPIQTADDLGYVPGELSLEWMRQLDCESVTDLLTSKLEGFGKKSAACVTLLCFHWKSFPVDVNVARICARLGWIPLKSAEKIEEMDLYAPELEVHKYLKARLSHFDFETLYELHYLMITMGKVFCTKSHPRCSACPLRNRCEYAQNGGKRFEKSVSIKKQRRNEGDETDALKPRTPIKREIMLRSDGPVKEENPQSAFHNSSTDPQNTPGNAFEDKDAIEPALMDIEDIAGIYPSPQKMELNALSLETPHKTPVSMCKPETPEQKPFDTSTYEIDRMLSLVDCYTTPMKHVTSIESVDDEIYDMSKDLAREILKMQPTETENDARIQYKQLSKVIHPDKCPHTEAGVAFSILNQAYHTITQQHHSGNESSELEEDEKTESFAVSHLPLMIRTPLTFTRSRNILHAVHYRDPTALLHLMPPGFTAAMNDGLFLLPDPRNQKPPSNPEAPCEALALITAKDAMENRFPLNGTFFQTNELFVIEDDSVSLPSRLLATSSHSENVSIIRVYFGTSVSRITLGMGMAEVTHLFNNCYVCVRNFNLDSKKSSKLHDFLSP